MNPQYAVKKIREILCKKSMRAYGTRNEWKKRAIRYGLSIGEIDQLMTSLITLQEKIIDELRSLNRQTKEGGSGGDTIQEVRSRKTDDESSTTGGG